MKNYTGKPTPETGKAINYDIRALRAGPQKLQRWVTQRGGPLQIHHKENETQAWQRLKKKIYQALQETYQPQKESNKKDTEPTWAQQAKQCIKGGEWGSLQEHLQ